MIKTKVNNKHKYEVEFSDEEKKSGKIDGKVFEWDVIEIKRNSFHIIKNNKSFTAEVVKADYQTKSFVIKVNGNKYTVEAKDRYDELLHKLGLDNGTANKINEMKAPMPGLVLEIRVSEGATVKKGDAIIVLEAMKMENILKSPADGTIKKVNVKKGEAVEKNQVLISFN